MQIFEKELADTDSIYCAKPTNSHQSSIFIGPTDGPAPCGLFGADYVSDMDVVIELSRDNLLLNVLHHFLCGTKYKKRGSNLDWELDKNWLLEKQLAIQKVFKGATARFHVSINKETTRTYLKGIAGVKAEGGTEKIDIRNYLFSGDVLKMSRKDDASVFIVVADRGGEEDVFSSKADDSLACQNVDVIDVALRLFMSNRYEPEWQAKVVRESFLNVFAFAKMTADEIAAMPIEMFKSEVMDKVWSFQNGGARSWGQLDNAERATYQKFVAKMRGGLMPVDAYFPPDKMCPRGMGVGVVSELLMRFYPTACCSYNKDLIWDALVTLGVRKGEFDWPKRASVYQDFMGTCATILRRMEEMKFYRTPKNGDKDPPDYITINEFLWFVHDNNDLIMQEWSKHMKHEIKLTNQTPVAENDFAAFIKKFIDAAKDAGLTYDDNLIKRFVCALLAKPFVVLTGLSGSGKTKLVQIFTQWIATQDMYRIVPVGADWTNSEKLLGYPNALDPNNYILPDTGVLKLMIDANDNPTVPFFLILDEMNLSHVERYFADFLSAMESEGSIKLYDGKNRMADDGTPVPPTIPFPKNLFVIGTMNVDETTHAFSPKVLDRAHVIEFRVSEEQINAFLDNPTKPDLAKIEGKGVEYAAAFLNLHDKPIALTAADKAKMNDPLKKFFPVLAELSSEFAFRTASEALKFCGFALKSVLSEEETVDAAIMQKLLPKLHGSRRRLAAPLEAFWGFCRRDDKTQTIADVCKKDSTDKVSDVAKFPVSAEKIRRLYKAAEQNGFASYAEA